MKCAITLGLINDKCVVLKDPSVDVDDHAAFIRDLTTAKGKLYNKDGKTFKQVQEAVVTHTAKGTIKRRKFK